MAEVNVAFATVPTFNEFDTAFRTQWAQERDKELRDSYRLWGDDTLLPAWVDLVYYAVQHDIELPAAVQKCLQLMDLETVVHTGDFSRFEEYSEPRPTPVAELMRVG